VNSERAQAYGRVTKSLDDLSGAKLHPEEQQTVREAADALFFCERLETDPTAQEALDRLYTLGDHLIEADRMLPETVRELTSRVEGCGPFAPVA
jgi:hypothetical protein